MMKWWRGYLYLRESDRKALIFLLVVLVVAIALIVITDNKDEMFTETVPADSTDVRQYSKVRRYSNKNERYYDYYDGSKSRYAVNGKAVRCFPFDPNTADSTELLALGFQPWQVRNIYKYRAAGGVYRRKEDLGKVYGLTNKQFRELEPYIRISKDYQPYVVVNEPRPRQVNVPESIAAHSHASIKLKPGQKIDLNSADTTQLMRVPGIGRYYARQIVNRRTWLGGYYTPEQLIEIEYLPKEAINYFYVNSDKVKKININQASLSDLKRHPYINYYQAKDIVDYRRLRGAIKNLNDLRLMKDFTDKDIERIKHYIEY